MRGLSAEDLLRVWEIGAREHAVDRALLLLGVILRDYSREDLALLGIGQRDGWLLTLRARTFGDRLDGFAECPACGERLEFEVSAAKVLSAIDDDFLTTWPQIETIDIDGYSIQLRLPNSLDLLAFERNSDAESAMQQLLERCILGVEKDGVLQRMTNLPSEVVDKIDDWMNTRDPLAEISIALNCAACAHTWDVVLDIGQLLWSDITIGAKRLLRDVHVLAKEYGWHEADILAMSPVRRNAYLGLLGEA